METDPGGASPASHKGEPRLLFVHAHPDDETLWTGVSLARYARRGADVRVLTCTLGDEGEVIPPELAHLTSAADDTLGAYRRGELRFAMAELGVTEHVLGEDPSTPAGAAYRDSGMAGTEENSDPRSLARAPLEQVAAQIRDHVGALRPDAVVTYEQTGGYGHPDHVRVHEATRAALAGMSATTRPPMFVVLIPASVAEADRAWVQAHVPREVGLCIPAPEDPYPPSVVDDAVATHVVRGDDGDLAVRDAALRHHRTQVTVFDGYYCLSNRIAAKLSRAEYFAVMNPVTGDLLPAGPPAGPPGEPDARDRRREGLL